MHIICPRCRSMNVKQVARRMKTKYGRVNRRFWRQNCGYVWGEERRTKRGERLEKFLIGVYNID